MLDRSSKLDTDDDEEVALPLRSRKAPGELEFGTAEVPRVSTEEPQCVFV